MPFSSDNPLEPRPQLEAETCEQQEFNDRFVQLLTKEQLGLFRYITALIGDPDEAGNILQETNLVLWRKASEFTPNSNFGAWARTIALWQVKACLRNRGRDRHVFSSELIQQLAERPGSEIDIEPRRQALRQCIKGLREGDLELLQQRYHMNAPITTISEKLRKSPGAVKSGLFRVRKMLKQCVKQRVTEGA